MQDTGVKLSLSIQTFSKNCWTYGTACGKFVVYSDAQNNVPFQLPDNLVMETAIKRRWCL